MILWNSYIQTDLVSDAAMFKVQMMKLLIRLQGRKPAFRAQLIISCVSTPEMIKEHDLLVVKAINVTYHHTRFCSVVYTCIRAYRDTKRSVVAYPSSTL